MPLVIAESDLSKKNDSLVETVYGYFAHHFGIPSSLDSIREERNSSNIRAMASVRQLRGGMPKLLKT